MMDNQRAFIFFVLVIRYVYVIRIHIAEIDFFTALSTYLSGRYYIEPRLFYTLNVRSNAFYVRGVCQNSPRNMGKFVHLF